MNVVALIKIIDLISLGVTMIPMIRREFDLLRDKLQVFADEGRDPTPEEWAEILQDSDEMLEFLRNRAEEARDAQQT